MPDDPNRALASMGIYVFEAEYLYEVLEKDAKDTKSSNDFGKDIIPAIVAEGGARAHPFSRSCVMSGSRSNPTGATSARLMPTGKPTST